MSEEPEEEAIVSRKTIKYVSLILAAMVILYVIANVCYNVFVVN